MNRQQKANELAITSEMNSSLTRAIFSDTGLADRMAMGNSRTYKVDGLTIYEFSPDIRPLKSMLSLTHLDVDSIDKRLR